MQILDHFRFVQNSTKAKALSCLGLVCLADWLFFDHQVGWTLGIFVLALCVVCYMHTPESYRTRQSDIVLLLIAGQALALIENVNVISCILVVLGFIGLAFLQKGTIEHHARMFARFVWRYVFVSWMSIFSDYALISRLKKKHPTLSSGVFSVLNNWLVPIGFSVVFVMLFLSANPILDEWTKDINFKAVLKEISFARIFFWIFILISCWTVIRPRQALRKIRSKSDPKPLTKPSSLISKESITRSLILFNAIFLGQTAMDITYLWGGAALPEGLTYAQYAHRGAYPLIVTALLAGLFVLVALKPGSESEQSSTIRMMVYIWIGQNIMLVISSIWRTWLYIEAYQLTFMRIAALIWMGLVAVGLALIVIRIVKQQTNIWLMNRNFVMLIAILYVCSFVNFGGIVAEYNIARSYEARGTGKHLDTRYLSRSIGGSALPALLDLKNAMKSQGKDTDKIEQTIKGITTYCYNCFDLRPPKHFQKKRSWRGWTLRRYRIAKYLEQEVN